jgi:hypothetical protein
MNNGAMTNCPHMAKDSFTALSMTERASNLLELKTKLKKALKVISIKTLADSFDLPVSEIVRIIRWTNNSQYRAPYYKLVIEMLNEMLNEFE